MGFMPVMEDQFGLEGQLNILAPAEHQSNDNTSKYICQFGINITTGKNTTPSWFLFVFNRIIKKSVSMDIKAVRINISEKIMRDTRQNANDK